MLLEDVFWNMKGFHVTRFLISQTNLKVQHKANQVWDTSRNFFFTTSMVPHSLDRKMNQSNSSSIQTKQ